MHATFFRMKRAHLTSLRYARAILRRHEPITPARYDLMIAVDNAPGGRIQQAELVRELGLHHSTVSKMLKRLDELGLIDRATDSRDARRRVLALNARGKELLHAARGRAVADGAVDLLVDSAVAPHRYGVGAAAKAEVRRTNAVLRRYALSLRDTAIPLYSPSPPLASAIAA